MNNIKTLVFNCNGVRKQHREFADFLQNHNIDIGLIQETHLAAGDSFKINNYKIFREDRATRSGGVAIVVKSSLKTQQIITHKSNSIEYVAITLETSNGPMRLASIYLPPTKKLDTTDIDNLFSDNIPTLIAGDFNATHPEWNNVKTNYHGADLYRYLINNGDICLLAPTDPTHYTSRANRPDITTIIDFALYKNINFNLDISVLNELNSDHRPIIINFNNLKTLNNKNNNKITAFSHHWDKFENILLAKNNNITIDNVAELELATAQLESDISDALENSAKISKPSKKIIDNSLPQEIRDIITQRNRFRRLHNQTGLPVYKTEVNRYAKLIKTAISTHRRNTWNEFVQELTETDPHAIPRILRKPSPPIPALIHNNIPITTDDEKAVLMTNTLENKYQPFDLPDHTYEQEVYQKYDEINNYILTENDDEPPIFTLQEVKNKIKLLKNKKAPGNDKVTNFVIKRLPDAVLKRITIIFNSILKLQHFPSNWKTSKIILIHKPGKPKDNPNSYRPIHLLQTISKLFEKVFSEHLLKIVTEKEILPNFQFGFRREHSTTMQLTRVVKTISEGFNNKEATSMVLMDMEAAFDKVNHKILIYKLWLAGIPMYICKLIVSYLLDRFFELNIENSNTHKGRINAGVPQGSILGPLLFNLLVFDIPSLTERGLQILQYADDIAILCTRKSPRIIRRLMQRMIDMITEYLERNGMRINPTKTEAVFFQKRMMEKPLLNIKNHAIQHANAVRYLGLILDHTLLFKKHVNHIITRARINYQRVAPVFANTHVPSSTKLNLYKSYLLPILTYAAPAWASISDNQLKPVQIYQNKKLRECTRIPRATPIFELHERTDTLTIRDYINNRCLNFHSTMQYSENTLNADTLNVKQKRNYYSNPINYINSLVDNIT